MGRVGGDTTKPKIFTAERPLPVFIVRTSEGTWRVRGRPFRVVAQILTAIALTTVVSACGSGKTTGSSSAHSNAGVLHCTSPSTTNSEGIVKSTGAPTIWSYQKECLEEDARATTDSARKQADEKEIAKGQKEVEAGQKAAGAIEEKAEGEATSPTTPGQ
jgi:hypothetical protein